MISGRIMIFFQLYTVTLVDAHTVLNTGSQTTASALGDAMLRGYHHYSDDYSQ